MIRIDDVVSAEDIKDLQVELIASGLEYRAAEPRSELLHKVRKVLEGDIRRLLRSLPAFAHEGAKQAWSHTMAVIAGRHLFPDANHRTAFFAFQEATLQAFGEFYFLDPDSARKMVQASKRMRDEDFLARGRYYSPAELASPDHPYRVLFRHFETSLNAVHVQALAAAFQEAASRLSKG